MSLLQKSPVKRQYSAKETCNFREPTNRSHPVVVIMRGWVLVGMGMVIEL